MLTYSLFTEDARYSAPSVHFVFAKDATEVRKKARELLLESADHLAVEVRHDDRLVLKLDRQDPAPNA